MNLARARQSPKSDLAECSGLRDLTNYGLWYQIMSNPEEMSEPKPLNVLCLGDAHFMTSNTVEMGIYMSKLEAYIRANDDAIDMIVVMGDTLDDHSRLHVTPLNMAVEYIKMLSALKPVFALVGNHDFLSDKVFLEKHHWLNCLKQWPNVVVVDEVRTHTVNGFKLVFCPYVSDGKFVQALEATGGWKDADCIFSHVTIRGAKMGSMIAAEADEWDPTWPMLISGHIHHSQWLGPNMYYTGSIMQVAVNEPADKHIALVEIGSEALPTIEEIDLGLPRKKILHLELQDGELCTPEGDEMPLDDLPKEPNTKYVLYISSSIAEFQAFRKSAMWKAIAKLPQIQGGEKGIKSKPFKSEMNKRREILSEIKGNRTTLRGFNELLREAIEKDNDSDLKQFWKEMMLEGEESDASDSDDECFVVMPKTK